jgi:hypothetical protein
MPEFDNEIQPDLIIRASSLSGLWDCPAKWKAEHLLGMRMPSGSASVIGTAIHAGTAVFDTARLEGGAGSAEDAVDAAADAVRNPRDEVRWDDCRPAEAIDTAARLTNAYCADIAPSFTFSKVEVRLNHLDVKATNGLILRFTGNIDRERVVDDQIGVADLKSGANLVDASGNVKVSLSAAQIGTYELITIMSDATEQKPHLLPAQIIALPTKGKHQPKVATLSRPPHSLLIGDEQNKGMIDIAADYFKNDLFVGNPRSVLCSERYCPAWSKCRWRMTAEAE